MKTERDMETKTDSNRPSTIRIIAGSLVLLCTFPIFVYGNFGIHELMQFPYKKYIVIPDDAVLTDCFLCDSETDEVKYIK